MKRSVQWTAVFLALLSLSGVAVAEEKADKQQDKETKATEKQSASRSDYRIAPSGWIRMAVDYDNDGSFDTIETIYTYDLQKARQTSRARANQNAKTSKVSQQKDAEEKSSVKGQRAPQRSSQETVTGKILQMRTENLFGMDEPCVLARLRTENNWPAKVVLGPQSKLEQFDFVDGDNVTVMGRKGRVNDKSMLIANKIKHENKTVSVDMPSTRGSKRVRAELLSQRMAKFRSHAGEFVIAKVELADGSKATVNLGLKSKLGELNLSTGDELRMIVRPAKINNERAMVADQVSVDGKTIDVSPPKRIARRDRASNPNQPASQEGSKPDSSAQQAALGIAIGETGEGVIILGVHPESPAAETDLRVGDAIVSVNGKRVDSPETLVDSIRELQPNDKAELKIRREGEEQNFKVRLTTRDSLTATLR